ncbi:MAG: hypothetical protein K1X47_15095 [Cyclobacteriaceae bacterium]|nr:hypothetical protein [Cyclobacteriaceae bacterium]
MKERERIVVIGLFALMLILWLGFAVHRSPRFPGSLWGGVLGVAGALLMLWPLGYSAVKRIPKLKGAVTKRLPMRTLLAWHVYTGIIGAVLAVLHTGHKFTSSLGILLTATMLVAVLTGVVGRYFMGQVSQELREKQGWLAKLQASYQQTADELARQPEPALALAAARGGVGRIAAALFAPEEMTVQSNLALSYRAMNLAESIADLEHAIKSHELLKRRFAIWLKLHIVSSVVFYILLTLHVWAGIYFGLRWFK